MIINPKDMVDAGMFADPDGMSTLLDPLVQIQPNGVDLRIGKLMKIKEEPAAVLDFDNSKRTYPEYDDVEIPGLIPAGVYLAQYAETVTIPKNAMAQVFMRSSLQRMGAYLFSSVYDSGYTGKGVGLLVLTQPIFIHENARIGQIVFHDAKSSKEYDGVHKGEGVTKKIESGKPAPKTKPKKRDEPIDETVSAML